VHHLMMPSSMRAPPARWCSRVCVPRLLMPTYYIQQIYSAEIFSRNIQQVVYSANIFSVNIQLIHSADIFS
jgi:hypothetical protein